jgi:hypothetical protein
MRTNSNNKMFEYNILAGRRGYDTYIGISWRIAA